MFEKPNRILIIGNSGSGKSWLASILAEFLTANNIALDDLNWEPGGFYKQKEEEIVRQELTSISEKSNWIVEGVYGNLAEFVIPRVTTLLLLDLDSELCAENAKTRGFDHIAQLDTENKINGYLNHVRSYHKNSGPMSREYHHRIYESFVGKKKKFATRADVNDFVNKLDLGLPD